MHHDKSRAHQHVTEDRGEAEDGAEARVHVGESGLRAVVAMPVNETPGSWMLLHHGSQSHAGKSAEECIGHIDHRERQACHPLVHVVVVEICVIDGEVPLDGHGTDNTETCQGEEE